MTHSYDNSYSARYGIYGDVVWAVQGANSERYVNGAWEAAEPIRTTARKGFFFALISEEEMFFAGGAESNILHKRDAQTYKISNGQWEDSDPLPVWGVRH